MLCPFRYEEFILQKETFTNSAPYRGADFERVKGLGAGQGGVVMCKDLDLTPLLLAGRRPSARTVPAAGGSQVTSAKPAVTRWLTRPPSSPWATLVGS